MLEEGDEVAGFRVVHTPGHARGHVVYFRESDAGDDLRRRDPQHELRDGPARVTRRTPEMFTYDPAENRRSIRKLAALEPTVLLPGHGPALTNMDEFQPRRRCSVRIVRGEADPDSGRGPRSGRNSSIGRFQSPNIGKCRTLVVRRSHPATNEVAAIR